MFDNNNAIQPISGKRWFRFLIVLVAAMLLMTGCILPSLTAPAQTTGSTLAAETTHADLKVDGRYLEAEDVAKYIHTYGKLPPNYITKSEAGEAGWESNLGNLWDVTDRMVIGGDRFGNREGLLPDKAGRIWYECDVNYEGGFRGAERLVYSNDGLIYYTADHYRSFERWYPKGGNT